MIQPSRYKDFEFIEANEKNIRKVLESPYDSKHRYFVEADLECRDELHYDHNDFSMTPEKISVTLDMLSPVQIETISKHIVSVGYNKKIIPDLGSKEKYVLHYRNLKYYTPNGLKITKIHRILRFRQKSWMKKYINFNTQRRMNPTNEADKNLYKLMNNAVHGKTMKNKRNRIKLRVTTSEKQFL